MLNSIKLFEVENRKTQFAGKHVCLLRLEHLRARKALINKFKIIQRTRRTNKE